MLIDNLSNSSASDAPRGTADQRTKQRTGQAAQRNARRPRHDAKRAAYPRTRERPDGTAGTAADNADHCAYLFSTVECFDVLGLALRALRSHFGS
ncbi:hypothetical protein [Inhella sp.]|uniref:hypothetical protein n=1 Tax=Inhella sp. TaxID=1921806 RepID=UPI0035B34E4B